MTGHDLDSQLPHLPLEIELPLDAHAGPATRLSRQRAAAMIDAALLEFDKVVQQTQEAHHDVRASGALPRGLRQAPARGSAWSAWSTRAVAAGALLALAGSAAAARYYFNFGTAVPAPAAAPAQRAPTRPQPQPIAAPEAVEAPSTPPNAEAAPAETTTTSGPAARSRAPSRTTAAEDLLQRANQQRTAGEFRQAADSYALVYERFPKTLSGYVARVAGASLELEHLSNAARARKLFEQALRDQPAGALDLEARQGLGMALRDLGDRAAERRALEALVAAHKNSPAARRAEARIRELAGE